MGVLSFDGSVTISELVRFARKAIGAGSKKDTPSHILKHCASGSGMFDLVLCDRARADIRIEAERQIAQDQFMQAKQRLEKAELAVELAATRRDAKIDG